MERLIKEKERKNEEFMKLQTELEAIRDVQEKKDLASKKMLENALKRKGIPD